MLGAAILIRVAQEGLFGAMASELRLEWGEGMSGEALESVWVKGTAGTMVLRWEQEAMCWRRVSKEHEERRAD